MSLNNYEQEINNIKNEAKLMNYTDAQIEECYQNSLKLLNQTQLESKTKNKQNTKVINCVLLTVLITVLLYILLYVHQSTSSLVLRNVQSFIYPGFKIIRSLAIPIISLFPTLTALYDETCLIENPNFQVSNLDCTPCQHVHSVINLTGLSPNESIYETATPFVINDQRPKVFYKDLVQMYENNLDIFENNAPWMITSNNSTLQHIGDVLNVERHQNLEILPKNFVHWRINRMLPARIVRKLFPRPSFINDWSGQSIERYILLDGAKSPGYSLPSFECSYVFLVQGSGERDIVLKATPECKESCRRISVRMKPSHVLWYNWWYWKPLSLPSENSSNISISYISSHC